MTSIVVQPALSRQQRNDFLSFPWTHYRGDKNWVPPLRVTQKEMVNYKRHPFYAKNEVQTFVAYRGSEVVGRIAAILNRGHIEYYHEQRGFFGFFECIDDQNVANALFDAARQWHADRGISLLRGPTNPSLNYELGLLIDGFDSPPMFMMTYNPPYYAKLYEHYGFQKTQDLYAFWGHINMLPTIAERLEPLVKQIIERFNVKLRHLDTSRFKEDVEGFLSIYNRSLTSTWGFVPMSEAEVGSMAAGLRHLIVPELTVAAEIDGKLVGAVFGLPDYNQRIKQIDGRLFPFGFLKLLRKKNEIKDIRVISTNVIPEYQLSGIGLALLHGLVPRAIEWGIQTAEFSWVLESNRFSRGSLEKGGAKLTKTYRLYDLGG
jgi:GNAT superfamily N-acetyltransferase